MVFLLIVHEINKTIKIQRNMNIFIYNFLDNNYALCFQFFLNSTIKKDKVLFLFAHQP